MNHLSEIIEIGIEGEKLPSEVATASEFVADLRRIRDAMVNYLSDDQKHVNVGESKKYVGVPFNRDNLHDIFRSMDSVKMGRSYRGRNGKDYTYAFLDDPEVFDEEIRGGNAGEVVYGFLETKGHKIPRYDSLAELVEAQQKGRFDYGRWEKRGLLRSLFWRGTVGREEEKRGLEAVYSPETELGNDLDVVILLKKLEETVKRMVRFRGEVTQFLDSIEVAQNQMYTRKLEAVEKAWNLLNEEFSEIKATHFSNDERANKMALTVCSFDKLTEAVREFREFEKTYAWLKEEVASVEAARKDSEKEDADFSSLLRAHQEEIKAEQKRRLTIADNTVGRSEERAREQLKAIKARRVLITLVEALRERMIFGGIT